MKTKKSDQLIDLGQRLKNVRKELLKTQKEMAETLGIAPNYLSEIEGGKTNPGAEFFLRLTALFNVNIGYLFHGTGEKILSKGRKVPEEAFTLDANIDSIEKLDWLMDKSTYVRNYMLGYAARLVLENEEIIRKSMEISKKK